MAAGDAVIASPAVRSMAVPLKHQRWDTGTIADRSTILVRLTG